MRIVLPVLVVLAIGAGAWYYFHNSGTTTPTGELFPVIDTHNHIAQHPGSSTCILDRVDDTQEVMEKYGIEFAVLMPQPALRNSSCDYTFYSRVVAADPEHFGFFGGGSTLNPMIQRALSAGVVSDELREEFEQTAREIMDAGALGFGELAAEHFSFSSDHPYESVPPNHELFLLLADLAAEYNVPIDLHMEAIVEEMPFRDIDPESSALASDVNPEFLSENLIELEDLLSHNPQAKFVWAHVGWDNTGDMTVGLLGRLLEEHPNLYLQLRPVFGQLENQILDKDEVLKDKWLALFEAYPDRFVIGFDSMYDQTAKKKYEPTQTFLAQLPEDLRKKIGFENAIEIYKIPVQQY